VEDDLNSLALFGKSYETAELGGEGGIPGHNPAGVFLSCKPCIPVIPRKEVGALMPGPDKPDESGIISCRGYWGIVRGDATSERSDSMFWNSLVLQYPAEAIPVPIPVRNVGQRGIKVLLDLFLSIPGSVQG